MHPAEFDSGQFGRDLRTYRKLRGLSLRDTEPLTGLTASCFARVESGRARFPGTAIILAAWSGLDLRRYVKFNPMQERTKRQRDAITQDKCR